MPADEGTSSELVLQRLRVLSWHLIGAVIISCFSGFISRDGVKGGGGSSDRKCECNLDESIIGTTNSLIFSKIEMKIFYIVIVLKNLPLKSLFGVEALFGLY